MAITVPGMRRVLASFLAMKATATAQVEGAPAVAAYESQSGGIVDMLEKLEKKFKEELDTVETEESNKAHAYDLEMLHLKNSIEAANADRSKKIEQKAQRAADSAEAKGVLADAKRDLEAAEKFLVDMTTTFRQKSTAFEMNQKVRTEELAAISKAVEIISSGSVSGAA